MNFLNLGSVTGREGGRAVQNRGRGDETQAVSWMSRCRSEWGTRKTKGADISDGNSQIRTGAF